MHVKINGREEESGKEGGGEERSRNTGRGETGLAQRCGWRHSLGREPWTV